MLSNLRTAAFEFVDLDYLELFTRSDAAVTSEFKLSVLISNITHVCVFRNESVLYNTQVV